MKTPPTRVKAIQPTQLWASCRPIESVNVRQAASGDNYRVYRDVRTIAVTVEMFEVRRYIHRRPYVCTTPKRGGGGTCLENVRWYL